MAKFAVGDNVRWLENYARAKGNGRVLAVVPHADYPTLNEYAVIESDGLTVEWIYEEELHEL